MELSVRTLGNPCDLELTLLRLTVCYVLFPCRPHRHACAQSEVRDLTRLSFDPHPVFRPMTEKVLTFLLIGWIMVSVSACVGPASRKAAKVSGATEREIGKCDTRSCFVGLLDYGGEIVLSRQQPDGSLEEIYKVRRKKGSTLRSFTHGVLSVATLGIWNVVGYPMEGLISSADFIVFRVDYDLAGKPEKVEIQGG